MDENIQSRRRAQQLRKNLTKEERHLWYDFLKTYPAQFKRQYPIGNYYADFYCYCAKLVVELDGSQHYQAEQKQKDKERTDYLQQYNITVLRIPNNEISFNFRGVCAYIDEAVKQSLRPRRLLY